jgi:uncharacterized protein YwqG
MKKCSVQKVSHYADCQHKLKANGSKHKAMSYDAMKQDEERLGKEIDELMQQAKVADAEEEDKLFNAIQHMKMILCAIFFGFQCLVPPGFGISAKY